jgi:hypothetical protein
MKHSKKPGEFTQVHVSPGLDPSSFQDMHLKKRRVLSQQAAHKIGAGQ